ncbi:MAG: hemerythrin family protein [Ignavibacteria bacterium]|nr:hemerythrin family protein [Ignavibacteria bacterium]
MNLIEWSDKENINIAEVDEQHEKFVSVANKLYKNLGSEKRWKTEMLLKELTELTKLHFLTEEKLMKENNYEGFFSHKLEHDRFLNKLVSFTNNFEQGEEEVTMKFLQSVKNWLINHLELNDRKIGVYLNGKGIK